MGTPRGGDGGGTRRNVSRRGRARLVAPKTTRPRRRRQSRGGTRETVRGGGDVRTVSRTRTRRRRGGGAPSRGVPGFQPRRGRRRRSRSRRGRGRVGGGVRGDAGTSGGGGGGVGGGGRFGGGGGDGGARARRRDVTTRARRVRGGDGSERVARRRRRRVSLDARRRFRRRFFPREGFRGCDFPRGVVRRRRDVRDASRPPRRVPRGSIHRGGRCSRRGRRRRRRGPRRRRSVESTRAICGDARRDAKRLGVVVDALRVLGDAATSTTAVPTDVEVEDAVVALAESARDGGASAAAADATATRDAMETAAIRLPPPRSKRKPGSDSSPMAEKMAALPMAEKMAASPMTSPTTKTRRRSRRARAM